MGAMFRRNWIGLAAAITLVAGVLITTGCATMGKDDCRSADWTTIGFEDGAKGYKASRIGRHREACAEYGVAPDLDQYRQGRDQGLAQWCTPHNGFRIGTGGGRYNGVCPADLEAPFLQAMDAGRQIFVLKQEVNAQTRQIDHLYRDLNRLEQDLKSAEDALITPGAGPQRRRRLLDEIRLAEADREAQLSDIAVKERSLEKTRTQLKQAETAVVY